MNYEDRAGPSRGPKINLSLFSDTLNPVLTKELLYTGIARTRHWFSLIEIRPGIFDEVVQRQVARRSGLMDALVTEPVVPPLG